MLTNKNKLTHLAYMIFFFLGLLFTNWGIFIIYMSKSYHLSLAILGYIFFIPTVFQAVTTIINGYYLHKVNLKKQVATSVLLFVIGITFIIISNAVWMLILGMCVVGVASGIFVGIPNYLIISLHTKTKFKKLNALNFFYSFGAIVGPAYAGFLLNFNVNWKLVIMVNFLLLVLIFSRNSSIPYSSIISDNTQDSREKEFKKNWHISIFLIAAAMLFYVLSECIFSVWIVSYLKLYYGFSIGLASTALTIFWFFIAIGRFSAPLFQHLKIYVFILLMSFVALISYILILVTKNITIIYILIAIMGIGYSSLYACLLSYGTDQLPFACPKLMSYLVLSGTIGVILAYPLSSFFVNTFNIYIALISGCVILVFLIIVVLLTLIDRKNPFSKIKLIS